MEVSGHLHTLAALHPRERAPATHWIGGWVGPRAGLDAWWWREKFPAPTRTQTPDHPACGLALYHWAIPAPFVFMAWYLLKHRDSLIFGFYNLYSSPDIVKDIISRRMKWTRHVICMEEVRNTCKILVRISEPRLSVRLILKWLLSSVWFRIGSTGGFLWYSNKPLGSIKGIFSRPDERLLASQGLWSMEFVFAKIYSLFLNIFSHTQTIFMIHIFSTPILGSWYLWSASSIISWNGSTFEFWKTCRSKIY
jgi:hypothetical protein